jgi:hypothetical protein
MSGDDKNERGLHTLSVEQLLEQAWQRAPTDPSFARRIIATAQRKLLRSAVSHEATNTPRDGGRETPQPPAKSCSEGIEAGAVRSAIAAPTDWEKKYKNDLHNFMALEAWLENYHPDLLDKWESSVGSSADGTAKEKP